MTRHQSISFSAHENPSRCGCVKRTDMKQSFEPHLDPFTFLFAFSGMKKEEKMKKQADVIKRKKIPDASVVWWAQSPRFHGQDFKQPQLASTSPALRRAKEEDNRRKVRKRWHSVKWLNGRGVSLVLEWVQTGHTHIEYDWKEKCYMIKIRILTITRTTSHIDWDETKFCVHTQHKVNIRVVLLARVLPHLWWKRHRSPRHHVWVHKNTRKCTPLLQKLPLDNHRLQDYPRMTSGLFDDQLGSLLGSRSINLSGWS